METINSDIAIVGGGPAALATAHTLQSAGRRVVVLEKGCLAAHIARFPTFLRFFSTPDLLELAGNLLDNAFKYGRGKVRVSAGVIEPDATRPGLSLSVEDDGAGIDESQWKRLLQRGIRGDERASDRVEGHGLGLAIVLELVTAYGGEVSIGRSELGGAMIRVEIPAA